MHAARARNGAASGAGGERVYPGTCRDGIPADRRGRAARAWRVRVGDARIDFRDRLQGPQAQDLARDVGDFVVRRADGLFAYQLAVVVDDALQGITHVVRGADLLASTPRQILLQRRLGYPTPSYLHVPIAINARGRKALEADARRAAARDSAAGAPRRVALSRAAAAATGSGHAGAVAEFWPWAVALEPGAAAAGRDASGAAARSGRTRSRQV